MIAIAQTSPSSEATKVTLYWLFLTYGDSLSRMAMVEIRPLNGSTCSQLAGSDILEYLEAARERRWRERERDRDVTFIHSCILVSKLSNRDVVSFSRMELMK